MKPLLPCREDPWLHCLHRDEGCQIEMVRVCMVFGEVEAEAEEVESLLS
jgi:hypothetical protein